MKPLVFAALLAAIPSWCSSDDIQKKFIYYRYGMNENHTVTVNSSVEAILDFRPPDDAPYPAGVPARVDVQVWNATDEFPLFVTASQQSVSSSWQLPMLVKTSRRSDEYVNYAHTLCPSDSASPSNWPLVHVSTESPHDVQAAVRVQTLPFFNLTVGNSTSPWINVSLQQTIPEYFAFRFEEDASNKPNETLNIGPEGAKLKVLMPRFKSPQTVILMVESDDDVCATVSVQNLSCPVYDKENDIKYRGYYFSMLRAGGITLNQAHFPAGFYVVLLIQPSDEECTGVPGAVGASTSGLTVAGRRVKNLRLKIVRTISYKEYLIAALTVLAGLVTCLLLSVALTLLEKYYRRGSDSTYHLSISADFDEHPTVMREDVTEEGPSSTEDAGLGRDGPSAVDSDTDSELLQAEPPERLPAKPTLADLARRSAGVLRGRSDKYLWGVLTIAVFYSLPVLQLVVVYQGMLQSTGDQDLCYYNFLCAHPLGLLSDFSHVYSNVGYVLLGAGFLALVARRRRRLESHSLGIPQHFGMYYAMGVSLMVEGILSASYHFCPNKMNFQFDSSFMYVMAVLCMVKLYQNRHPDINARAHSTFAVLACVIFLGLSGILASYQHLRVYMWYWVGFCLLRLAFNLWLSFQIYYMGRREICFSGAVRAYRRLRSGMFRTTPDHPMRFIMLCIANVANILLDIYGLYEALHHRRDAPVHLLQVLLMNTALYMSMYIVMKLRHAERITPLAALFLLASNVLWALSLYLFVNGRTKWALTPAQSRSRNAPCDFMQFLDNHDAWHLTSAVAMFTSFQFLLAVDDDLALTPRHKIYAF